MKLADKYAAAAAVVLLAVGVGFYAGNRVTNGSAATQTIYVVNHAAQSFSNKQILRDIPAWEIAANRDFAPAWHTPQIRIKLVKRAPLFATVAYIEENGPVQGALAYHTINLIGEPQIVVYAGVANAFGYSNSIDFTHELFETLGDWSTQQFNVPWFAPPTTMDLVGKAPEAIPTGATFIQEACDPVEAARDAYKVNGVPISDFVTLNWWNDQMVGGFDFTGHLHAPYTIDVGGYASYEVDGQWGQFFNFSKAGPDAAGFYRGEKMGRGRFLQG